MTHADYFMTALCLWREARGEGRTGQVAVGCVIRNRVLKRSTSYYVEIIKPWAFSSMTARGDLQLALYPVTLDSMWAQCQQVAQEICDGLTADVTAGATLYWNPKGISSTKTFVTLAAETVAFPESWNPDVVTETVQIGAHIFLREK
jgi:N-acetylmuramoyl-L-alanine amidase